MRHVDLNPDICHNDWAITSPPTKRRSQPHGGCGRKLEMNRVAHSQIQAATLERGCEASPHWTHTEAAQLPIRKSHIVESTATQHIVIDCPENAKSTSTRDPTKLNLTRRSQRRSSERTTGFCTECILECIFYKLYYICYIANKTLDMDYIQ